MGILDMEDDFLDEGWADEDWADEDWADEDWADEDWADEDWADEDWRSGTHDTVAGMRLVLSDEYSAATDADMEDAIADVMDALSPAEAFNFGAALNQIGRGAGQVMSDPVFQSVARTALPIAGGALGTVIGGPVGTALGSQLGTIAANSLSPRPPAKPPARPPAGPQVVTGQVVAGGTPVAPAAIAQPVAAGLPTGAVSTVSGGSSSAAQGLVLAGHPLVKQALAAAAFGQHGQQQIAGIPVAQLLGLLSQVVGQAAADADELFYLSDGPAPGDAESWDEDWEGEGESDSEAWSADADGELYDSIMDADNLELVETMGPGWAAP